MRRWLLPALAAVLVAGAAGTFAYSRLTEAPPDPGPTQPAAAGTVVVERTDLANFVMLNGTLGFGPPTTFTGRKEGTVTGLPSVGAVVDRGQTLYEVNAQPVPLLFGNRPLYRTLELGVTPGPDVSVLVDNLRALGYRTTKGRKTFDETTQAALKSWQKEIGLPETGVLGVGDAVVLPGTIRIDSLLAHPAAPATGELFAYTSVGKVVTAEVDPQKINVATLHVDGKVTLTLPNGTETVGTVSAIGTSNVPSDSGDGSDGAAAQAATITVDDQNAVAGIDSGPVNVKVVTETRRGVLAVPVNALLALSEGGYALQVATGKGAPRLIRVELGLFADNLVEVTGDGLTEGMRVVRAT